VWDKIITPLLIGIEKKIALIPEQAHRGSLLEMIDYKD